MLFLLHVGFSNSRRNFVGFLIAVEKIMSYLVSREKKNKLRGTFMYEPTTMVVKSLKPPVTCDNGGNLPEELPCLLIYC